MQRADQLDDQLTDQLDDQLAELVERQHGVVSRRQLLASGLSRAQAVQRVRAKRWQRLHPGVYATFTGAVDDRARVQAALLAAGPGSVAGRQTALWLAGFRSTAPDVVQVCVPLDRRVAAPRGASVNFRTDLEALTQPGAAPPRVRFEAAVLDVADATSRMESVISIVLEATQRRFTTVARLRAELARRSRHRWRSLVNELLADAAQGVASPLERRYLTDVERAHGLPRGRRNAVQNTPGGRRYPDVRYERWRVVAELDGRAWHPSEEAFRDWRRDNASAVAQVTTLRYGWLDLASEPCQIAQQVAQVLRHHGWPGHPHPCPRCPTGLP